jgi:glycerol-3-phosphate dehydrogenase
MGEDVIDQAETLGGLDSKPCPTKTLQIHGWTHSPISEKYLKPYGADVQDIRALLKADPTLDEQVHPDLMLRRVEVLWHVREEMARTVEDVLARRSRSLLLNAKASIEAAPAVAALMAKEFGRDEAWEQEQVRTYTELAQGYVF